MSGMNATSTSTSNPSSTGTGSTSPDISFQGGDPDAYISVFQRDGGILSSDNKSRRYMQEHEAMVEDATRRIELARHDRWKEQDVTVLRMRSAGLDGESVAPRSVRVDQTPRNQLNFRILGARLS